MPSNPLRIRNDATPFQEGDNVMRWVECPDCDGRGWFLINPFATGGRGGAGGLSNMRQCPTCRDAYHEHAIHCAIEREE